MAPVESCGQQSLHDFVTWSSAEFSPVAAGIPSTERLNTCAVTAELDVGTSVELECSCELDPVD